MYTPYFKLSATYPRFPHRGEWSLVWHVRRWPTFQDLNANPKPLRWVRSGSLHMQFWSCILDQFPILRSQSCVTKVPPFSWQVRLGAPYLKAIQAGHGQNCQDLAGKLSQDFAEQHRHRACEVLGPHAGAEIIALGGANTADVSQTCTILGGMTLNISRGWHKNINYIQ